jgi:hypothetical protein
VLVLSPVDPTTLYLGTQYVMKTADGGLHWETISPDLTGATGDVRDAQSDVQSTDGKKPPSTPTLEHAKRAPVMGSCTQSRRRRSTAI